MGEITLPARYIELTIRIEVVVIGEETRLQGFKLQAQMGLWAVTTISSSVITEAVVSTAAEPLLSPVGALLADSWLGSCALALAVMNSENKYLQAKREIEKA